MNEIKKYYLIESKKEIQFGDKISINGVNLTFSSQTLEDN
jgi:riboflavin synthase alpha subunit